MTAILLRGARVLSMGGSAAESSARRGAAMNELGVIQCADVEVLGPVVSRVTPVEKESPSPRPTPAGVRVIEARGRVLMPAFVDAHTHACWAGDRLDEWEARRKGVSYLDILKAGGGIMSTVRAVRKATQRELTESLLERLSLMLSEGTTTVEVKSGYGLSTEHELKMLRAIADAASKFPGHVEPTALLGHALDPDVPAERFIRTTIDETLPAVHTEFPRIAVDAFCESGAWGRDACCELLMTAGLLGHRMRVHSDQFSSLGMTEWAVRHGAASVDHLEATPDAVLREVAASRAFGVMLPCAGFHLMPRLAREPGGSPTLIPGCGAPVFADGRAFVDAGGKLAIATNYNPGSAPCPSMPMAIALAVRMLGLTPAEAICAATVNGAALFRLPGIAGVARGSRADLVLLRHTDERMLAYEFGGSAIDLVLCAGRVMRETQAL